MKPSSIAQRTDLQASPSCPCRPLPSGTLKFLNALPQILLAGLLFVSQPATAFSTASAPNDAEAAILTATSASEAADFQTEEYIAPGYPLGKDEQVFAGLFADSKSSPDTPATAAKQQAKDMQELLDLDAAKARSWQEKQDKDKEDKDSGNDSLTLRERMVRDCARTISFQKACALRYQELNKACEERADLLGSIFSFSSLLIDGHILPPVLGFAGPVHTLHDKDSASTVDETYTIRAQARIVSIAPSWRDYLTQNFEALEIRPECLPKSSKERSIWQEAVRSGWAEGRAQAEEVFQQNMERLTADYRGMLKFSMLYKRGLVSLPVMAKGHIPIRVGKTTLDINQTVFRLTRQSLFQNPQEDAAKAGDRRKKPKNPKRP